MSRSTNDTLIPATRWVHIEDIAEHAIDYMPEDDCDSGNLPEYIKALKAYTAAVKRRWEAARAKAVARVDAE